MKLRKDGNVAAAKLYAHASTSSQRATEIMDKVKKADETTFTPLEALNIMVATDLSKESYVFLREAHRKKQCYMYPSYEKVLCEKQKCYPEGIKVEEFQATIPLQNLLDHTAQRLVVGQQTAIDVCMMSNTPNDVTQINNNNQTAQEKLSLELLYKYGIDGSGDQALYSMKYDQERHNDINETSILSSFICPIRLSVKENGKLVWQNPSPSSPFFCRPIKLQFIKETAEVTRQEISESRI